MGAPSFFGDIASFKGDPFTPFTLKSGANRCTKGSGESQLRCQAQKMAENGQVHGLESNQSVMLPFCSLTLLALLETCSCSQLLIFLVENFIDEIPETRKSPGARWLRG